VDVATPLEQVIEILPFDAAHAVIGTGQGLVLGFVVHRGKTIPVVDLGGMLGRPGDPAAGGTSVLLVQVADREIGYLVPALRAIERSLWEEGRSGTDGEPDGAQSASGAISDHPLLQIGEGTDTRMLPLVDLEGLAVDLLLATVDTSYPDPADEPEPPLEPEAEARPVSLDEPTGRLDHAPEPVPPAEVPSPRRILADPAWLQEATPQPWRPDPAFPGPRRTLTESAVGPGFGPASGPGGTE
jgi:chemotaxis signal transduction protein